MSHSVHFPSPSPSMTPISNAGGGDEVVIVGELEGATGQSVLSPIIKAFDAAGMQPQLSAVVSEAPAVNTVDASSNTQSDAQTAPELASRPLSPNPIVAKATALLKTYRGPAVQPQTSHHGINQSLPQPPSMSNTDACPTTQPDANELERTLQNMQHLEAVIQEKEKLIESLQARLDAKYATMSHPDGTSHQPTESDDPVLLDMSTVGDIAQIPWMPSHYSKPECSVQTLYAPNYILVDDLQRSDVKEYLRSHAKEIHPPELGSDGRLKQKVVWKALREDVKDMQEHVRDKILRELPALFTARDTSDGTNIRLGWTGSEMLDKNQRRKIAEALKERLGKKVQHAATKKLSAVNSKITKVVDSKITKAVTNKMSAVKQKHKSSYSS